MEEVAGAEVRQKQRTKFPETAKGSQALQRICGTCEPLAERKGFEPLIPCGIAVLQTAAINPSAIFKQRLSSYWLETVWLDYSALAGSAMWICQTPNIDDQGHVCERS
jgi:hypothetical protein